jgi:iron-sulfur cluster repair protein YtfE (RIC family)
MTTATYKEETVLFDGSETLNTIVARYPQALTVLQSFGLDTCCGGALPLSVAAEHHALDLVLVMNALRYELTRDT